MSRRGRYDSVGRGVRLAALGMVLACGFAAQARSQDEGMGGGAFAGGQIVRGTVTAVAGEKLTIKTEQGDVYQVVTTTNTRVMQGRQPVKVGAIAVGSGVGAMGLLDAPSKTVHAMMVMVVDPEQVKKAREGMGKVYIAGKVTKIEETTLTIARTDGVVQTIEVDEGTSFKRAVRDRSAEGQSEGGGIGAYAGSLKSESITLPDIKVGDQVAGQGALKNGVFVPKELSVLPPGFGQGGRRGMRGSGAGNGAGAVSPQ